MLEAALGRFHGVVCLCLALTALAALSCGEPRASSRTAGRRWATEFKGGVTRNWFPEEQIDVNNPPKVMVSYEVTTDPQAVEPTADQRKRAEDFIKASFEAAQRHGWFEFGNGLADGYVLMHSDPLHYVQRDYIMDDELLNPDKPESLMYYDTPSGKRLAGVMYLTRTKDERGPQFGGPLTIWHYHVWESPRCMDGEMLVCGVPLPDDACEVGVPMRRSPEMMHVWFFNHPHGPFATTMTLPPQIVHRLEERGF
jgi:hypothetical protein